VICSTEYEQSDWKSTRRSFQSVRSYEEIRGAFDARVVSAHRGRYQRLFNILSASRNGDRHRNTLTTVEVIWRQKPTKLWALSCLHSLACKA